MNALDLLDPKLALSINGRPVVARRGPTEMEDPRTGELRSYVELWTGNPHPGDPDVTAYDRHLIPVETPVTIETR